MSGPFAGAFGHPAINNSGTVIFTGAKKDGTGTGIFASRHGGVTTLIEPGIFNGIHDRLSINDRETVAFQDRSRHVYQPGSAHEEGAFRVDWVYSARHA